MEKIRSNDSPWLGRPAKLQLQTLPGTEGSISDSAALSVREDERGLISRTAGGNRRPGRYFIYDS